MSDQSNNFTQNRIRTIREDIVGFKASNLDCKERFSILEHQCASLIGGWSVS